MKKLKLVLFYLNGNVVEDYAAIDIPSDMLRYVTNHLVFIFNVSIDKISYTIQDIPIPMGPNNSTGQYIETFLTKNKKKMECYLGGIRHEIRTAQYNEHDGFCANNCRKVKNIHTLGTVHIFKEHGYVAAGAFWFRFLLSDLIVLSN